MYLTMKKNIVLITAGVIAASFAGASITSPASATITHSTFAASTTMANGPQDPDHDHDRDKELAQWRAHHPNAGHHVWHKHPAAHHWNGHAPSWSSVLKARAAARHRQDDHARDHAYNENATRSNPMWQKARAFSAHRTEQRSHDHGNRDQYQDNNQH
jgi:hypothetical protein